MVFDSELMKLGAICPIDDTLKQLAATLKEMTTTSACNCAVSKAVTKACDMMMSVFSCWLSVTTNYSGIPSGNDITPFANIVKLLHQSLIQTLKLVVENSQVTVADILYC